MTDRNLSSARLRLARLGGVLAIGAALMGAPAALAAEAGTPAPAAAPAAPAAAAAAAPKPTDVVAKVGDVTITEGDLGLAAQDLQQQLQNVPPQAQKAFLTGVMIDMQLMAQAARAEKLDQTPGYKAELAYLEARLEWALRERYWERDRLRG